MKKTRFPALGYKMEAPGQWSIYYLENDYPASVGPKYRTEKELLSDLDRYATEFGY